MKRLALSIICVLFWLSFSLEASVRAEGPGTSEKIAILAPQPVAPSGEALPGLKVTRLEIPVLNVRGIQPFYVTLGWNEKQAAYAWHDDPTEREPRGCWGMFQDGQDEVFGLNIPIWCHRQARVGPATIDLALLRPNDPVQVWLRDKGGEYYAVEFTVRWLGLLPRELEADFKNPTDGWVLTLVTCAIEPGLPPNPTKRIFVRATIDEETNYGVWHTVVRGETLSEIAKIFELPTKVLAEANNLPDPNKINAGQFLFVPLAQRKIVENY